MRHYLSRLHQITDICLSLFSLCDNFHVVWYFSLFPFLSLHFFLLQTLHLSPRHMQVMGDLHRAWFIHYSLHLVLSVICLAVSLLTLAIWEPGAWCWTFPPRHLFKGKQPGSAAFLLLVLSKEFKAQTTYQTFVCESYEELFEWCQMPVWCKMLLGSTF